MPNGPSEWSTWPIAAARDRVDPRGMIEALVLAGGLVPLAAMIVAIFAAAWLREGPATPDR